MEMKLELIPVPVSNIDVAKSFYIDMLGFHQDHDVTPSKGVRVVQLTPKGSACSIALCEGMPMVDMPVGMVKGLHLVVRDIVEVHRVMKAKGLDVGDVIDMGGILYVPFSDPDGNQWVFQEIPKEK